MEAPVERRRCPRVPFNGITIIRQGRVEIPCMAHDLSASGMLLYPQRRGNPGTEFRVTFVLPSLGKWLDLEVRLVRRIQPYSHRVGWAVQFVGVPSVILRMLRKYVYSNHTAAVLRTIPTGSLRTRTVTPPPPPAQALRHRSRMPRSSHSARHSAVTRSYPTVRRQEKTRAASREQMEQLLAETGTGKIN